MVAINLQANLPPIPKLRGTENGGQWKRAFDLHMRFFDLERHIKTIVSKPADENEKREWVQERAFILLTLLDSIEPSREIFRTMGILNAMEEVAEPVILYKAIVNSIPRMSAGLNTIPEVNEDESDILGPQELDISNFGNFVDPSPQYHGQVMSHAPIAPAPVSQEAEGTES